MGAETEHQKVRDGGGDEGMDAAIAKGVVYEKNAGDEGVEMASWGGGVGGGGECEGKGGSGERREYWCGMYTATFR